MQVAIRHGLSNFRYLLRHFLCTALSLESWHHYLTCPNEAAAYRQARGFAGPVWEASLPSHLALLTPFALPISRVTLLLCPSTCTRTRPPDWTTVSHPADSSLFFRSHHTCVSSRKLNSFTQRRSGPPALSSRHAVFLLSCKVTSFSIIRSTLPVLQYKPDTVLLAYSFNPKL